MSTVHTRHVILDKLRKERLLKAEIFMEVKEVVRDGFKWFRKTICKLCNIPQRDCAVQLNKDLLLSWLDCNNAVTVEELSQQFKPFNGLLSSATIWNMSSA